MSQQHEAVARRLFDEVWNTGNYDAIASLVAPDFVNHDPLNGVRGPQGYQELVTKYRQAFPDTRLEIDELLSAGDRVVARFRFSGTHRGAFEGLAPTGRAVNGTGIAIFGFAGDRIQEAFVNSDQLGLMQQLGAVTLPGKTAAVGS